MPLTGTTSLTIAMEALAKLVASSATFRTVVQAADATAALTSIHWPEANDRLISGVMENPRPRCIIRAGPQHSWTRRGPGNWSDAGLLELAFEFIEPVQYRDSTKDALFWFCNTYGTIIDEMRANSGLGSGTYLNVTGFELFAGPDYPDDLDPNFGDCYAVAYLCQW